MWRHFCTYFALNFLTYLLHSSQIELLMFYLPTTVTFWNTFVLELLESNWIFFKFLLQKLLESVWNFCTCLLKGTSLFGTFPFPTFLSFTILLKLCFAFEVLTCLLRSPHSKSLHFLKHCVRTTFVSLELVFFKFCTVTTFFLLF